MTTLSEPARGPWMVVWVCGLLLAVATLGGIEVFLRSRGYAAGMSHRLDHWCHWRQKLSGAGPEKLALLGSSRMQMGFVPSTLREERPGLEPVMLAVAGTGPAATLRDLAKDDTFRGIVLCSVVARTLQWSRLADQEPMVNHYRTQWGPGRDLDLLLTTPFQLCLAQLQAQLSARNIGRWIQAGELPGINFVTTRFDRTRVPNYSKVELEHIVQKRLVRIQAELAVEPPVAHDHWLEIVDAIASDIQKIEARGGRVAFVRFPSSDRYRSLEEQLYPRDRYWDILAERTGAVSIHYTEMPGCESLVLPDETHLDHASAVRFTRWLASELLARGVLADQ